MKRHISPDGSEWCAPLPHLTHVLSTIVTPSGFETTESSQAVVRNRDHRMEVVVSCAQGRRGPNVRSTMPKRACRRQFESPEGLTLTRPPQLCCRARTRRSGETSMWCEGEHCRRARHRRHACGGGRQTIRRPRETAGGRRGARRVPLVLHGWKANLLLQSLTVERSSPRRCHCRSR